MNHLIIIIIKLERREVDLNIYMYIENFLVDKDFYCVNILVIWLENNRNSQTN